MKNNYILAQKSLSACSCDCNSRFTRKGRINNMETRLAVTPRPLRVFLHFRLAPLGNPVFFGKHSFLGGHVNSPAPFSGEVSDVQPNNFAEGPQVRCVRSLIIKVRRNPVWCADVEQIRSTSNFSLCFLTLCVPSLNSVNKSLYTTQPNTVLLPGVPQHVGIPEPCH